MVSWSEYYYFVYVKRSRRQVSTQYKYYVSRNNSEEKITVIFGLVVLSSIRAHVEMSWKRAGGLEETGQEGSHGQKENVNDDTSGSGLSVHGRNEGVAVLAGAALLA